jgi:hypothetical protein
MPGSWVHLTARFFDVVSARPLTSAEQAQVGAWLSPAELALFVMQSDADQRHGYETGRDVTVLLPDRPDLVRAAALHDVGKRHAHLGAIGRVFASLAIRFRVPVRGRFSMYARHGELAAVELAELGSPRTVVDFARYHHDRRPDTIPLSDWAMLEDADRARLPVSRRDSGYAVSHQSPHHTS